LIEISVEDFLQPITNAMRSHFLTSPRAGWFQSRPRRHRGSSPAVGGGARTAWHPSHHLKNRRRTRVDS
jgi:alkylated DNA repair dioxygenase AlkB